MAKKKLQNKRFEPERDHGRLNRILSLQRENDIIQLLLEGKERSDIVQYVASKYMTTPLSAGQFITNATNILKERSAFEVNNLISLHVGRYEVIYALLYEIGSLGLSMKALRQKEKLMGFHKEGFHMRVQSGTISAVQLQTINGEYDVMRLGKDKQSRMTLLLEKAKRQGNENAEKKFRGREKKKNVRLKHLKQV